MGTSRSMDPLWVRKYASQITAAFSVSVVVRVCSSTTIRWTGDLGALLCLVNSVQENPLVDVNKVLLPPLHIKLGLMKNFVKAMDKNGTAFQHLCTLLPALSSAKLIEGIFVRPQIQEVLKDKDFEELFTVKELRTWEAFKSVCHGFFGILQVPRVD